MSLALALSIHNKQQGPRPVTGLPGGRGWTVSTPVHLHTVTSFRRTHGDVSHGGSTSHGLSFVSVIKNMREIEIAEIYPGPGVF